MKRYRVSAEITISMSGYVQARTAKDAMKKAAETLVVPTLCHQCSEAGCDDPESWALSGELDGEARPVEAEEAEEDE